MDVIHPRCCGMDISKRDAKVCVRIQRGATVSAKVTTWSSLSSQILKLAAHLRRQKVTLVVMEATGDYWKPFYFLLVESGLEVMLVNARQARQIPGRKTDVADAVWLADLAAHGLLRGSFVPPPPIRELKDLVRTRTTLVRLRGQEAQRLEKLLESAAIKLSSTIDDIVGLSGRRMLEAMIAGVTDPTALASLADRRIKASTAELAEALTGRFTDHHAFLATVHLGMIDSYTRQINAVAARIDACFTDTDTDTDAHDRAAVPTRADMAAKRDLLTTIPGVSTITAERIIAEIGIDMTAFELPPVGRTPALRWLRPPGRMSLCLPHTPQSSAGEPSSSPVRSPNRSPSWPRSCKSRNRACGIGWPRPTPTRTAATRSSRARRRRNSPTSAGINVASRWKSKSLNGRRRTSPGRTSSQIDLPAGP